MDRRIFIQYQGQEKNIEIPGNELITISWLKEGQEMPCSVSLSTMRLRQCLEKFLGITDGVKFSDEGLTEGGGEKV